MNLVDRMGLEAVFDVDGIVYMLDLVILLLNALPKSSVCVESLGCGFRWLLETDCTSKMSKQRRCLEVYTAACAGKRMSRVGCAIVSPPIISACQ